MNNPFKSLNFGLMNIYDSIEYTLFEWRKSRKYEHTLACDVLLVYPTGMGEWFKGKTDEANTFLWVPLLLRIWEDLHPIIINGRKIFIVSSDYHGTLSMQRLGQVANMLSYDLKVKLKVDERMRRFIDAAWKYRDNIIEWSVENAPGTINPHLFDTKFSQNWTASSFKIMSTRNLSIIDSTERKVFLMSVILAGGFGLVIGAFLMALISLAYFYMLKGP